MHPSSIQLVCPGVVCGPNCACEEGLKTRAGDKRVFPNSLDSGPSPIEHAMQGSQTYAVLCTRCTPWILHVCSLDPKFKLQHCDVLLPSRFRIRRGLGTAHASRPMCFHRTMTAHYSRHLSHKMHTPEYDMPEALTCFTREGVAQGECPGHANQSVRQMLSKRL